MDKLKNSSDRTLEHCNNDSFITTINLVHSPDKFIDIVFTIASIASFNIVISLLLQATKRRLKFEWPEKIVCLLKVRSNCQDLMGKVFNADNTMFSQSLSHKAQVGNASGNQHGEQNMWHSSETKYLFND